MIPDIILGVLGNALYDLVAGTVRHRNHSGLSQYLKDRQWERLSKTATFDATVKKFRSQHSQHALTEIGNALEDLLQNDSELATSVKEMVESPDSPEFLTFSLLKLASTQPEIENAIKAIPQSSMTIQIHQDVSPIELDRDRLLEVISNRTIPAELFLLLLIVNTENLELNDYVIEGNVDISKTGIESDEDGMFVIDKIVVCHQCHFKGLVQSRFVRFDTDVDFSGSHFDRNIDFADVIFNGNAGFRRVRFIGDADFQGTHFNGNSNFSQATFHNDLNLGWSTFQHHAYFDNVTFGNNANFQRATFQGHTEFGWAMFQRTIDFRSATFAHPASFAWVSYYPHTIGQRWKLRFLGLPLRIKSKLSETYKQENPPPSDQPPHTEKRLPRSLSTKNATQPTQFYLDNRAIDPVSNPRFKQYIADQQFIRTFKERHPASGWIWRWSSDYGRSFGLWTFWSTLFVLIFGLLYRFLFPSGFIYSHPDLTSTPNMWNFLYYSIVTFTTLGSGDMIPAQPWTKGLAALEVIFGYLMLGILISILVNRFARRD